jgi:hypothetical protein
MHSQLAKMAQDLVNAAPIRGVDAENTAAVKQWLRQIASGQLVVSQPKLKKPRKAPEPTK